MKEAKGITLIALVITIIVMLILAGVTINMTLGEIGIFSTATSAVEKQKIVEYLEKIELSRIEVSSYNMGKVTIDDLKAQILKDKIVIPPSEGAITKVDEEKLNMTTKEGYIFFIYVDRAEYIGKDGEVPIPSNDIIINEPIWNNGKASVTIKKGENVEENIQIQYQVNSEDGKWTIGSSINDLKLNDIVYARLWNGIHAGDSISLKITETSIPTASNMEVIDGIAGENDWYRSDVTVKIIGGNDTETGVEKVTYILTGATNKEETTIENGGTIKITQEGITTISSYTYDKAGNKSAVVTKQVKKDTIAPTINLTQKDTTTKEYSKLILANIADNNSGVKIKKYESGNRGIDYFRTNGTSLGDSFNASIIYNKSVYSQSELYTVYTKDEAGNQTIKTITVQNLLVSGIITGGDWVAQNFGVVDQTTGRITLPGPQNGVVAVQYGPYWNLPKGTYEITYTGENLYTGDNVKFATYSCYVFNVGQYTINIKSATPTKVVYEVNLPENAGAVEFAYANHMSNTIYIDSIQIKQLN